MEAFDPAKHIKGERERGVLYNFLVEEVPTLQTKVAPKSLSNIRKGKLGNLLGSLALLRPSPSHSFGNA